MKYIVKNTAIKINHKIYNIGDEIEISSVPNSIKHLLQPLSEHVMLSGAEASSKPSSKEPVMLSGAEASSKPGSKEPVILSGAEVSKYKPESKKSVILIPKAFGTASKKPSKRKKNKEK